MSAGGTSSALFTGLTREDWEAYADRLLEGVRRYASPSFARVALPGASSCHGPGSDALEGFARTFELAAFRIAGANGDPSVGDLIDRYASGFAAGADLAHIDAWPRIDGDYTQPIVEAASIAVGLHITRRWLWDRLDAVVRDRVVDWLAGVVGRRVKHNNWVLFITVIEEFLASVGGPHEHAEIIAGLQEAATWQLDSGWYSDGPGRSVDHYNGWALHLYPLLWTQLAAGGARAELAQELGSTYRSRLGAFLEDYVHLIGADGAPLHQGRSLIYRMAAAAPLWAGEVFDCTPLAPGQTRRAASGILRYFMAGGVPNDDDLLTLGWTHPFAGMVQPYSGAGSPYWAAKGFLGLLLPSSHPAWTADEQPLPVETADVHRVLRGPNWLVQSTRGDGIVRVHNHGSDAIEVGAESTDDPYYAHLWYSTATAPRVLAGSIADDHLTLIDPQGASTGRGRIHPLHATVDDGVGYIASWHTPRTRVRIETHVVTFGRHEVRVHLVQAPAGWMVREGGHNLSGAYEVSITESATVAAAGRTSAMRGLHGYDSASVDCREDADALGRASAVPYLTATHPGGQAIYASWVSITGDPIDGLAAASVTVADGRVCLFVDGMARLEWAVTSASDGARLVRY